MEIENMSVEELQSTLVEALQVNKKIKEDVLNNMTGMRNQLRKVLELANDLSINKKEIEMSGEEVSNLIYEALNSPENFPEQLDE